MDIEPAAPQSDPLSVALLQPLALEIRAGGLEGTAHPSTILDFADGASLTVSAPVVRGRPLAPEPGTPVVLHPGFAGAAGAHEARVLRGGEGKPPRLVLTWPSGPVRVNLRRSVRVAADLAADVAFTPAESQEPRALRARTVDLSEDGAQLRLAEPLPTGTLLSIHLHLPVEGLHVCGGRVTRGGASHFPGGGVRYWAGVEFVNLSTAMQRALRHFVWDLQRELLRNGR
jgi:c-di-GMP-binding flagellar brake protein YcgR